MVLLVLDLNLPLALTRPVPDLRVATSGLEDGVSCAALGDDAALFCVREGGGLEVISNPISARGLGRLRDLELMAPLLLGVGEGFADVVSGEGFGAWFAEFCCRRGRFTPNRDTLPGAAVDFSGAGVVVWGAGA